MWLLLLEIALMVIVWKRGWKWWALLPLGVQILGITAIRGIIELTGRSQPASGFVGDIADALLVLVLVAMVIKGRRNRDDKEIQRTIDRSGAGGEG